MWPEVLRRKELCFCQVASEARFIDKEVKEFNFT
jgi:hypothetical protein